MKNAYISDGLYEEGLYHGCRVRRMPLSQIESMKKASIVAEEYAMPLSLMKSMKKASILAAEYEECLYL
jgi:hypothetical protein